MAPIAQVDQKKNEKHNHTDGKRRNAIGCSETGAAAVALSSVSRPKTATRSSMASRLHHSTPMTSSAHAAMPAAPMRHDPVNATTVARNAGDAAHPRLPEMP